MKERGISESEAWDRGEPVTPIKLGFKPEEEEEITVFVSLEFLSKSRSMIQFWPKLQ